jgi:hypothetical protein
MKWFLPRAAAASIHKRSACVAHNANTLASSWEMVDRRTSTEIQSLHPEYLEQNLNFKLNTLRMFLKTEHRYSGVCYNER